MAHNGKGGIRTHEPLRFPVFETGTFNQTQTPYHMSDRGGIRTHGAFRLAGFQDQFLKPLGHPAIN